MTLTLRVADHPISNVHGVLIDGRHSIPDAHVTTNDAEGTITIDDPEAERLLNPPGRAVQWGAGEQP